jgi:hypothetical protein
LTLLQQQPRGATLPVNTKQTLDALAKEFEVVRHPLGLGGGSGDGGAGSGLGPVGGGLPFPGIKPVPKWAGVR